MSYRRTLEESVKSERKLARDLGFHSGIRGQRELKNFRERLLSYPQSDPRWLQPELKDDFIELRRLRALDKRHRTPEQTLIRKKEILVDDPDAKNHMSSKAFRDRYRDAILAALQSNISEYRKRQLRKIDRELARRTLEGDNAPLPEHIRKNDEKKARFDAQMIAGQKAEEFKRRIAAKSQPRKFKQSKKQRKGRGRKR